jgi:hypothetical protein
MKYMSARNGDIVLRCHNEEFIFLKTTTIETHFILDFVVFVQHTLPTGKSSWAKANHMKSKIIPSRYVYYAACLFLNHSFSEPFSKGKIVLETYIFLTCVTSTLTALELYQTSARDGRVPW